MYQNKGTQVPKEWGQTLILTVCMLLYSIMARPLRIEFPGALYHVISRGDNKQQIFLNDNDRNRFLQIYSDINDRLKWITYAWCFMDNHYHFVIETPQATLSEGMRLLNGIYTQSFNHTHGRTGHLFQGRYKSILVDKENYLLELARYVVLNPVRAELVEKPEDWFWSSYRSTAGLGPSPEWLNTEWILSVVADCRSGLKKKQDLYAAYVLDGITGGTDLMKSIQQQIYLGDEDFVSAMQNKIQLEGDLSNIAREQKRKPLKELEDFEAKYSNRKEAMAEAYFSGNYSQAEIARHFRVHYSTVSKAVRKFRN